MSEISKVIGQRIRGYRINLEYSQEKLAELAFCHPTYIGQIERGEKNPTIESIEKITRALGIPISELFQNLENIDNTNKYPSMCYELILSKDLKEQKQIYKILTEIDSLKRI